MTRRANFLRSSVQALGTGAALVVSLLLAAPHSANAQAYCALRDPSTAIAELFPESTSYRTIVRVLGEEARLEMRQRFALDLRANELGQHSVYVVFAGEEPLGFVHVRSEKGRWGLVEIAWAIDLDLRIVDLRIQRGHDDAAAQLLEGDFVDRLRGRNLGEYERALGDEALLAADLPTGQREFALLLLRAAPRTIAATWIGWRNEIAQLRQLEREQAAIAVSRSG
ncbi:MAG: hypothetical protein VCC00_05370 [Deltaproteobacteria bacterium]